MMWSSDRFCGTRDKTSMNDITAIDIPIYMYRNVSQRINHRRPIATRGPCWSVRCGSFFDLKCADLSFQFVKKLGFALKTNSNRKFDPLLNVFDTFCIHADA